MQFDQQRFFFFFFTLVTGPRRATPSPSTMSTRNSPTSRGVQREKERERESERERERER